MSKAPYYDDPKAAIEALEGLLGSYKNGDIAIRKRQVALREQWALVGPLLASANNQVDEVFKRQGHEFGLSLPVPLEERIDERNQTPDNVAVGTCFSVNNPEYITAAVDVVLGAASMGANFGNAVYIASKHPWWEGYEIPMAELDEEALTATLAVVVRECIEG